MSSNVAASTSNHSPQKKLYASSIPPDLVQPLRNMKNFAQRKEQEHIHKDEEMNDVELNENTVNSTYKLVVAEGQRPVTEAILKGIALHNEGEQNTSKFKYFKNKLINLRPIKKDDNCGKTCCKSIKKSFPFLKMLSNYQWKEWILLDLSSGFSVGMFIIPQAIAFSLLANVAPQYGFFSAFFSMVIYFFLGTSNHVNMSSQGVVSLLVGQAVKQAYEQICGNYATNSTSLANFVSPEPLNISAPFCSDSGSNIRIALTLTIFVGVFQLAMGIFQLGWLTIYLADPLVSAFTCGAAFHIVKTQIPALLGISVTSYTGIFNLPRNIVLYIQAIPYKSELATGINYNTIIISAVSIIVVAVFKIINEKYIEKLRIPIPIDIIVLIISLLLSRFLNWSTTLRVANVGEIKNGFESPRLPEAFLIKYVIVNAIILAIISYSIGISISKSFAVKHGYEVDPNQELVAYGSINVIMSFFSTFVTGSSLGCSSMHESLSGKTQMYSTVAATTTLIGILTFASYFSTVPKAVVGAIILVNLKKLLLKFQEVPALWRINKFDLIIWLVTFGAVIILDVDIGLGVGVGFSLVTVIYRTQKPEGYIMGRIPGTSIYRKKKKNKVEEIVGIKIFKFEGNLYFASAENFRRRLYKCTGINPKKILERINRGKPLDLQNVQNNKVVLSTDQTNIETVANQLAQMQHLDEQITPSSDQIQSTADLNVDVEVFPSSFRSKKNARPFVLTFSYIVLDMSTCSFVDSVGIRVLTQIIKDYRALGIEVYLACIVNTCKELFRKAGFYNKTKEEYIFVTVHDAVLAALQDIVEYAVDWDSEKIKETSDLDEIIKKNDADEKNQVQLLTQQINALRNLLNEKGVDNMDENVRSRKQSYIMRRSRQNSITSFENADSNISLDMKDENSLDQRRQLRRMLRTNSQNSLDTNLH